MTADPTAAILGDDPALAALRARIRHLAAFDGVGNPHVPTVLLEGETGTGKGLVAGVLHRCGPRARGPFVDVNCAAIPETMLEAELFGFEAGAFTDARRPKPGLFEAASGGTLFLDEVDALSTLLQSKLLKAIEEKTVRRLGAVAARTVDVKLIAATQRDLRTLVADGRFRADLYHRLAVLILDIPPLRARGEDVVALAEHFLAEYAQAHGLPPKRLTDSGRRWLVAQTWPGNVRELSHLLERVTLLEAGQQIDRDALARLCAPTMPSPATRASAAWAAAVAAPAIDDDERERIRLALARSGGNVVAAARLLGIGRNALRYRMRQLGVARPTLDDLQGPPPMPPASGPLREVPSGGSPPPEPPDESAGPWESKPAAVVAMEFTFTDVEGHAPWIAAARLTQGVEEVVRGFGGVFYLRSPSRLCAVFGVPRTLEQTPQRAVQAALAVRRLVDRAAPPRPELRIAVHLGSVSFETASSDESLVLLPAGATLSGAELLLGHAAPNEILVSSQVARRIAQVCRLRATDVRLRLGTTTLQAHAVLAPRAGAAAAEELGESRFVGRGRELQDLEDAFAATREGHGQVVFVVGDAGIGKSRLLAEFRKRLAGTGHRWIEGHCAAYGSSTAFLPIVDGLRRSFGIDDRDDEASAGAKVEQEIRRIGDVEWTLPFVRGLLSLPADDAAVEALDSGSRRSETFRALRTLAVRSAEHEPTVVLIEDLHWIDPASEEYLAFLADAVPGMRTLLVCSHRPGYSHPFGDRSYHVRIAVRPLSPAETDEVACSLLGTDELPEPLRLLVARKAEGNPFFVEEVTRALVDDGSLRQDNGRIVLGRELGDVAVPDTIQDVLRARIDRLAVDARRAIQIAAVIGREFALRLLERITEAGSGVRSQVEELRALELIYEKALHPELAYMFKHALTHDVAYDSVQAERRKALHQLIGLAIEELYADRLAEHYETLAYHFTRSEDWQRALAYHERASEKAETGFANRAVVEHVRAALALCGRLAGGVAREREHRLYQRIAAAHFYLSEFSASGAAYERASALADDPGTRAIHLGEAAHSHVWGHDYAASERALDAASELAESQARRGPKALAVALRGFHRGVLHSDIGGYRRMTEEALALCRGEPEEAVLTLALNQRMQIAEWTGDYRQALVTAEQVIAAGKRLRLAHFVIWPTWFIGKACCVLGDYGRAIAELREAHEICNRLGDRVWRSRMLNTLGWCFAEIGAPDRARECNEQAARLAHDVGDPEIIANSEINLAGDHLALGDAGRALAYLEPIEATLACDGDPWMRWRWRLHALHARARLEVAGGRPDHALVLLDDEIARARRHEVPKVEARALALRGRALLEVEQPQEARQALEVAAALAERIGYARAAWQAHRALALVARRTGDRADADRHAAAARTLAERAAGTLDDAALRARLVAGTEV